MSTATLSPALPLAADEITEAAAAYRAAVAREMNAEITGARTTLAEHRVAAARAGDEIRLAGHRALALLLEAERHATLAAGRTFLPGIDAAERAETFRAAAARTDAVQDYLRELFPNEGELGGHHSF